MLQPLNWTEFSIWGLLGFGGTIPTNGMTCLILRNVGDKRIISFDRPAVLPPKSNNTNTESETEFVFF